MRRILLVVAMLLPAFQLQPASGAEERPEKEVGSRPARPELPAEVAKQVRELEGKVEDLRKQGIEGDDRAKQDAALGEAIKLAEEVLAIREKHQGQADGAAAAEKKGEWWEVADARWFVRTLKLIRGMDGEGRKAAREFERELTEGVNLSTGSRYRNREAEQSFRNAAVLARSLFQGDHPYLGLVLNNLAKVSHDGGDLQSAEEYYRESLDMARRFFPGDHPDVATSLNNLALLLKDRGDLQGAEPLLRLSLGMRRRLFPGDHSDIAMSLNILAALLQDRGDLQGAEPLSRESLDMRRRLFPGDHPHVATSLNNLSLLLGDCGDLQGAEPLVRESLDMRRRLFPGDYPDVATSLNNLALLLEDRGDLQGAEPFLRESLAMRRRLFPSDHPDVATSLDNLAALLETIGDLQGAEPLLKESRDMRLRLFPGDHRHPAVATSLNNLALLLKHRGDFRSSEPLLRESLDIRRRFFPGDHPDVARSLNNLAMLLQARGDLQGAEPLLRESREMRRRLFPGDHPGVAASLYGLALLFEARGDLQGAEPPFREALDMAERLRPRILGDEKARAQFAQELRIPGLASSYAALLVRLGRPAEAFGVCERGRARSFLDLLERGALDVLTKAKERSAADPAGAKRLENVLAREEKSRIDLTTAELRSEGLQKERKTTVTLQGLEPDERERRLADLDLKLAAQLEEVKGLRRALSDANAALFVELRGLFPEAKPLSSDEVLTALPRGDLVLGYLWSPEQVVLATAGDGGTSGAILAGKKEEVQALLDLAGKVRTSLTSPLERFAAAEAKKLIATLLPEEARERAARARRLVVLPDGPLNDVPFEALLAIAGEEGLREKPVVHAASATIYLQRLKAVKRSGKPSAVLLGAPIYDRDPAPRPKYPEKGALITNALAGSNAATAGLRRGDVLLAYDGNEIEKPAALSGAIASLSKAIESGKRAEGEAAVRFWRDGEEKEARVKPGKLGVQIAQGDPASALDSMARSARGFESLAAEAGATDQVRLHGGTLEPLVGTLRETLAIAELIEKADGEAEVLTGEGASTTRLAAAAPGKRFLHLATHGFRGTTERPYDASLALTRPKDITPQDIGFLRLEDLLRGWRGKLEGTQLVVLSACETQRGAKVGDSAMSLPWGFFYAGAKTVIASLWRVDDEATSLLMVRLYENLLGVFEKPRQVGAEKYPPGTGMGPEPALREARSWLRSLSEAEAKSERARVKELARSAVKALSAAGGGEPAVTRGLGKEVTSPVKGLPDTGRPYEHPYYWAAFICVGSPE